MAGTYLFGREVSVLLRQNVRLGTVPPSPRRLCGILWFSLELVDRLLKYPPFPPSLIMDYLASALSGVALAVTLSWRSDVAHAVARDRYYLAIAQVKEC
jgi:hypothetical protein